MFTGVFSEVFKREQGEVISRYWHNGQQFEVIGVDKEPISSAMGTARLRERLVQEHVDSGGHRKFFRDRLSGTIYKVSPFKKIEGKIKRFKIEVLGYTDVVGA